MTAAQLAQQQKAQAAQQKALAAQVVANQKRLKRGAKIKFDLVRAQRKA